jgi:hypothetical protein
MSNSMESSILTDSRLNSTWVSFVLDFYLKLFKLASMRLSRKLVYFEQGYINLSARVDTISCSSRKWTSWWISLRQAVRSWCWLYFWSSRTAFSRFALLFSGRSIFSNFIKRIFPLFNRYKMSTSITMYSWNWQSLSQRYSLISAIRHISFCNTSILASPIMSSIQRQL